MPTLVVGGYSWAEIIATGEFTCGILANKSVACFGYNYYGQFGNGNTSDTVATPTVALGGLQFSHISATDYTFCALVGTDAYCAGDNTIAELGIDNPSVNEVHVPMLVAGGHSFVSLSGGMDTMCALDTAGLAWCWGEWVCV